MKQRDSRLDTLKGVLIILVILGHLIGECGSGVINGGVRTFIYTFHMPLFILISGYLSKIVNNKTDFWKGLLHIAIPLGIFQAINIVLLILFQRDIGLSILVVPYWTLWYLLSLLFWRIMLQYSPAKLLGKPLLYLSIALGVSIFCGLMQHGRLLSVQRTLNFFPFFLFGYYIRQGSFTSKLWSDAVSVGFICLISALIAFGLFPPPQICGILQGGADHYELSQIPAKIYMLACSFVASISIYNITRANELFAHIGKESLFYYLYHGILISFVVQPLVTIFDLPRSFPFMLLYCVSITIFIHLLGKVELFRWFTQPLTEKLKLRMPYNRVPR